MGWRPRHAGNSPAGVLVELDLDQVMANAQVLLSADRFGRVVVPLVDDQIAVYPDTDPVVASGGEAIRAGILVNVAGPARGKVIHANTGIRGADPPVVVQVGLAALEHGRAGKRHVVPIRRLPGRVGVLRPRRLSQRCTGQHQCDEHSNEQTNSLKHRAPPSMGQRPHPLT